MILLVTAKLFLDYEGRKCTKECKKETELSPPRARQEGDALSIDCPNLKR
jgi:hypothetical protein